MPLDAQDKVLHEEIAAIFRRAADSRLAEAGSELTKVLLEVLPPGAPFRKEILRHIKRAALLTLVQAEQAVSSG